MYFTCDVRTSGNGAIVTKVMGKTFRHLGPPGFFGIWGKWLIIFRDLGSTDNYFRGAGEQSHSFGDLGSPAKKQK